MRTGRALGQFPFVAEQVLEEVVAPLRRRRTPSNFQAAADRVIAVAAALGVVPTQALLLDGGGLRYGPDILVRIGSTVPLTEGVPARNERNRLLVIHRHASERFADVPCRGKGIGISIGPFRVNVNQAHLNRRKGIREIAVAAMALVRQPLALGALINVVPWLPDVLAPATETEGLEPH